MKLFFNWLIAAIAILIASYLLPGVETNTFITALIVAVVLGLVNMIIRPILLLLTLPVTVATLGLFTVVINAFMVWIVQLLVPGFTVANFGWAVLFAILLALINMVFRSMDRRQDNLHG